MTNSALNFPRRFFLSACASTLLLSLSTLAYAQRSAPDLGGLKLGMSTEEAIKIIETTYPKQPNQIFYYRRKDGSQANLADVTYIIDSNAGKGSMDTGDQIHVKFAASTGKLYSVFRELRHQNLLAATLQSALAEKFGQPTVQDSGSMNWFLDSSGNNLKQLFCGVDSPQTEDLRCAFAAQATWIGKPIVTSYRVSMFTVRLWSEGMKVFAAEEAAAQSAQEKSVQSVKPKL